ncbi:MAG: DUF1552 domain-containing protein [Planctomycetes bacterium]|nr:DUF1552 domain-containing protein [Planctomycetota bacterium]
MGHTTLLARRTFLKGLSGTAMGLPLLEAMLPQTLAAAKAAKTAGKPPVRMAFVFFPNGAIMPEWRPCGDGEHYYLSKTLEPLEKFKSEFNIFTGLAQDNGRAKGDGPGDHARCASTYLTGAHPYKTSGADIRVGVSVDQIAADKIGRLTKLPSLELGIDRGRNAGNCDSGYSCAYSSNIAWKTETTPLPKEINPRLVFERLFGSGDPDGKIARRNFYRKSILDLVAEDASKLQQRLGKTDRRKIDEYFTSVREIEQRIIRADRLVREQRPDDFETPPGIPSEMTEHIRLMYDLMLLAFRTDTTRICTFMLGNAGSNRTYPWLGVREGHHTLSHHGGNKRKREQIRRIDRWLIMQFRYLVEQMKAIKEGEGTLYDNMMALYGCAIADGNAHNHENLPVMIAGRAGGAITPGRYVRYRRETPMSNLFLSMLDIMGVKEKSFGDSKGRLSGLKA